MKHLRTLPIEYIDEINDPEMSWPVAIWQTEEGHEICEMNDQECDKGKILFGTEDSHEPKFCPFHYFTMSATATFRPTK
jgi:hypothetical protein